MMTGKTTIARFRRLLVYILWTWGISLVLFFGHGGHFWHLDALWLAVNLVISAGSLTVGIAAYLGIRAGEPVGGEPVAGFRDAIRTALLLAAAEAISGLFFCVVAATYVMSHGLPSTPGMGPGARSGLSVAFSIAFLLLVALLAGFAPCIAAFLTGKAVVARPQRPRALDVTADEALGRTRRLGIAAAIVAFAIVDAAVIYWLRLGLFSGASTAAERLVLSLSHLALGIVTSGALWACAVILWFVRLRVSAESPPWLRALLLVLCLTATVVAAALA